jgi:hypothetical protein
VTFRIKKNLHILEEKGKKHWNLKCYFYVGGKENEFRRG